jgi:hypothetical protein
LAARLFFGVRDSFDFFVVRDEPRLLFVEGLVLRAMRRFLVAFGSGEAAMTRLDFATIRCRISLDKMKQGGFCLSNSPALTKLIDRQPNPHGSGGHGWKARAFY